MTDTAMNLGYRRVFTIPNMLTVVRIFSAPLLIMICVVWWPKQTAHGIVRDALILGVYAGACLLDFFDGHLARAWNQRTRLGAMLDPIADKVLVAGVVGLVAWIGQVSAFDLVLIGIILGREIATMFARHVFRIGESLKVSYMGKVKAFAQMIAVGFLLLRDGEIAAHFDRMLFHFSFALLGTGALLIAGVLTVVSGMGYAQAAWRDGDPIYGWISIVSGFFMAFLLVLPFWPHMR